MKAFGRLARFNKESRNSGAGYRIWVNLCNRADGISEIEGKAAKGTCERVGKERVSNLWTIVSVNSASSVVKNNFAV